MTYTTDSGMIAATVYYVESDIKRIEKNLLENIAFLERRLNEAKRDLDKGRVPSGCGIVQGTGNAIDMDVARLEASRDVLFRMKTSIKSESR